MTWRPPESPPRHPSGRPRRHARRADHSWTRPTRDCFLVDRLNHPRRELTGGFGFRIEREYDDFEGSWA